jgi:hypothetical protein
MKIIITEDKVYDLILKYINSMFDVDNIGWTPGIDDWGNEVDYAVEFYTDDYEDGGDNTLFRWYGEDYWRSEEGSGWGEEQNKENISESPILEFEDTDKLDQLNGLFGHRWHKPFIDWFWDNFNIPVKTIE